MGINIPQTTVDNIPTGEYPAVIKAIEETDGQFGKQLQITFELSSPEQAGRTFKSWVSPKFNPKSRLYELTSAAFGGAAIPESWDFDSDKILNRKLVLVIGEYKKKDGNLGTKVLLYKPAPRQKPVPVAKPAPRPAPAADEAAIGPDFDAPFPTVA